MLALACEIWSQDEGVKIDQKLKVSEATSRLKIGQFIQLTIHEYAPWEKYWLSTGSCCQNFEIQVQIQNSRIELRSCMAFTFLIFPFWPSLISELVACYAWAPPSPRLSLLNHLRLLFTQTPILLAGRDWPGWGEVVLERRPVWIMVWLMVWLMVWIMIWIYGGIIDVDEIIRVCLIKL